MAAVLSEIKEGVAVITLNREDKLNAFNREMCFLLHKLLDQHSENALVRAVYITGKGTAFSAGQDLAEVADPNGPGPEKILPEQLNPIVTRIRKMQKPVIAAVNGVAAGAGANIALSCDIVMASSSAFFIQAFSKIGLIPDSGGTFFLPRIIGWQKAAAIMMLGEKISAAQAESWGMIYKVFPDDVFAGETMRVAMQLAKMPTRALALTKEALNRSVINNFAEQLDCEVQLQTVAGQTKDYKEGVRAFIEKRKPIFKGE